MISDCCSLVQHVEFSSIIQQSKVLEKRLTMDLHYLKDEVLRQEYLKELMWADTTSQLADCLTKSMKVDYLAKVFKEGRIQLRNHSAKGKGKTPKEEPEAPVLMAKLEVLKTMFGEELVENFLDKIEAENYVYQGVAIGSGNFKRKYNQS